MNCFKLICFVLLPVCSWSQELNCKISVANNARTEINSAQKEVITQLEQTVFDFMNATKWTKEIYELNERLDISIQFQIKDIVGIDQFKGSIQVQVTRPVFNSSYNTLLLNFLDENADFSFARNTVLVYSPNTYKDNLSSILSFYAMYALALDADSFSKEGGTQYFNEAQQIVLNAQSAGSGWKSSENGQKNRFWLVDNALQELFKPLRQCYYDYHRIGLDNLYSDQIAARKDIVTALNGLLPITATRPNNMNIMNFAVCKRAELKSMFASAEPAEKTELVNLLKKLDPANSSKYDEFLEG